MIIFYPKVRAVLKKTLTLTVVSFINRYIFFVIILKFDLNFYAI